MTLSSVFTSTLKPFFMVRRLMVAARRSMNGIMTLKPAYTMRLNLPSRSMMTACCCFTTKNACESSHITMMAMTTAGMRLLRNSIALPS